MSSPQSSHRGHVDVLRRTCGGIHDAVPGLVRHQEAVSGSDARATRTPASLTLQPHLTTQHEEQLFALTRGMPVHDPAGPKDDGARLEPASRRWHQPARSMEGTDTPHQLKPILVTTEPQNATETQK